MKTPEPQATSTSQTTSSSRAPAWTKPSSTRAGLDRVFDVLALRLRVSMTPSVELSGVTVTGGEANWGAGISVDCIGTLDLRLGGGREPW